MGNFTHKNGVSDRPPLPKSDFEQYFKREENPPEARGITFEELKEWLREPQGVQLVDLREEYERESRHLGGDLIPLATLQSSLARIARDKPVVFYSTTGRSSAWAVELLRRKHGFDNLWHLEGGLG